MYVYIYYMYREREIYVYIYIYLDTYICIYTYHAKLRRHDGAPIETPRMRLRDLAK